MTRCDYGHDLTLPGALLPDTSHGGRRCLQCRRAYDCERKRRYKEAGRTANPSPRRRSELDVAEDSRRNLRLLEIGDELQRNPMPWDRDRLIEERDQLMRQQREREVSA